MTDTLETITPPAASPASVVLNNPTFNINVQESAKAAAAPIVAVPKVVPKHESKVTITETHSRDSTTGQAIVTWRDSKSAEIILRDFGKNGTMTQFKDSKGMTAVYTAEPGFKGFTVYQRDEFGKTIPYVQRQTANPIPSSLPDDLPKGKVQCGPQEDHVSAEVLDAVTRDRLQAFAKAHPELSAKLRASNEKITQLSGVSVTLQQVENTAANFLACPADTRSHQVVQAR